MARRKTEQPNKPASRAKKSGPPSRADGKSRVEDSKAAFATLRYLAEPDRAGARKCVKVPLKFPRGHWAGLEQAAMEWTYVLRSRQRWAASDIASEEHVNRATEDLQSFGISPVAIQQLARAKSIEVQMPANADDDDAWQIRIFPWEYVLAGATRPYRHGDLLTVTRTLEVARRKSSLVEKPSKQDLRVLYVESAPGEIGKRYDFRGERELIDIYLMRAPESKSLKRLYSPTIEQFTEMVELHRPHIIHLSGVDNHEGRILLRWAAQDESARGATSTRRQARDDPHNASRDGYLLSDEQGEPCEAGPEAMADTLTGNQQWNPWLVCMNLENSAPRVAPRAVQRGCHATIGFQDSFDPALAELFFGTLYADLSSQWDLAAAFHRAWSAVHDGAGSLLGTGVVLWSDTPQIITRRVDVQRSPHPDRASIAPGSKNLAWIRSRVGVKVKPKRAVNYSLLHNDGELFDEFSIKPTPDTVARDVSVRVTLSAGVESADYSCSIDLNGRPIDLRRQVKVPLSANLIRSVHEAINSTWRVEIAWGQHVLLRETYPVRLLPIDQWRDAESGRSWLPSFVFPRDRAVGELVAKAADYVRVIRDDPAAGFEGYQCLPDPEKPAPRDAVGVDLQVQAIWSTILYEWRLTYINPPPTYSVEFDSQRLRTPSMIARDRHGTCIDLALLLAACLELVDIWPVIFLLNDHAFPGYWRADAFHGRFRSARPDDVREIMSANSDSTSVAGAQRYPWAVGRAMTPEIVREIREGRLVPLETVRLTENCGFAEAIEAGKENFEDLDRFEFLIDIAIARQHDITPLPLVGDPA